MKKKFYKEYIYKYIFIYIFFIEGKKCFWFWKWQKWLWQKWHSFPLKIAYIVWFCNYLIFSINIKNMDTFCTKSEQTIAKSCFLLYLCRRKAASQQNIQASLIFCIRFAFSLHRQPMKVLREPRRRHLLRPRAVTIDDRRRSSIKTQKVALSGSWQSIKLSFTQLKQMGKLKNLKKLEKLKPYALWLNLQPKRLLALTSNDRREW